MITQKIKKSFPDLEIVTGFFRTFSPEDPLPELLLGSYEQRGRLTVRFLAYADGEFWDISRKRKVKAPAGYVPVQIFEGGR